MCMCVRKGAYWRREEGGRGEREREEGESREREEREREDGEERRGREGEREGKKKREGREGNKRGERERRGKREGDFKKGSHTYMYNCPTWSMQCTSSGQRKAAVFPEPVLAMPMMSRPLIAAGIAYSTKMVSNTR